MKFKMIDQYTVRCILTEDDMIENEIELEDFFHNREKVHDLLELIMDKAKDEVGYELSEEVLSMQIMPLPMNGLAITISGKNDKEVSDLIGNVKKLASMTEEDLEDTDDESDGESDGESNKEGKDVLSDILQDTQSLDEADLFDTQKIVKKPAKSNVKSIQNTNSKDGIKIFRFASLNEVEDFCLAIQRPKYITSHLFKDKIQNCYYLVIEQGKFTTKTFNMVCGMAIEFADLLSHQSSSMVFISEHCEALINKKAIFTMRKIASVS